MKTLILAVVLFIFPTQAKSSASHFSVPDSLLTEDNIRNTIISHPKKTLFLLDEVEKMPDKTIPQYKIDLYRSMVYSELRIHSLQKLYAEKVLSSDSINYRPEIKLQSMTILLYANSLYENYANSIELADNAINLARELSNLPAEYVILQTISDISFKTGNREDGYNYLQRIIDGGADLHDNSILAIVSSAYGKRIMSLYDDMRYEEAFSESKKRLELIERMNIIGGTPEGFIDQQKSYSYAKLASIELMRGNPRAARTFYRRFLNTEYGKTDYAKAYALDYLLRSRQYGEALKYLVPLYDVLNQSDTINVDYYKLISSHSAALAGVGDYKNAYNLSLRSKVIQDSLFMREKQQKAQELAMTFKLNEKELALLKSDAKSKHARTLLTASLGVVFIILIGLFFLFRQYRISLKRNRIAAKQIDELIAQKEKSYQFQTVPVGEDSDDYAEFVKMEKYIVDNSLFLQHNFNRDSISEQCNIPRSKVLSLIQQFADMTPGDYINKLKVLYSVKLIKEHKEWTIDAIARESGYSNRSTYYQNFYKVLGLTPAQYRKQTEGK